MRSTPATIARHCRRAAAAIVVSFAPGLALAAPDEAIDPVAAAADPGLLRKVHERASAMVVGALNFIGVRYQRGGSSADNGFDCSGFTRHVFEMSLGRVLPRSADEQAAAPGFLAVKREDLRPGDLVFFNTLKRTFSHVGIYIGDNRFIHAPRSGQVIRTEDMSFAYWADRFTGARRADPGAAPEQAAAAASAVPALSR